MKYQDKLNELHKKTVEWLGPERERGNGSYRLVVVLDDTLRISCQERDGDRWGNNGVSLVVEVRSNIRAGKGVSLKVFITGSVCGAYVDVAPRLRALAELQQLGFALTNSISAGGDYET